MKETTETCLLCKTPYLAPGVRGCTHSIPEYIQLRALEEERDRKIRVREQFEGSLKPRYRKYQQPVPAEVAFANQEVVKALKSLTAQSFLYLWGAGGVGKTHFAVRAALTIMVEQRVDGLYVNEDDYFDALGAQFGGGPKAPDLLVPGALIYDDAGKKSPSPTALQQFYRMLENRWAYEKATIITSNRPPEALAGSLARDEGEASAILSRLRAGRVFEVVSSIDGREGSAV